MYTKTTTHIQNIKKQGYNVTRMLLADEAKDEDEGSNSIQNLLCMNWKQITH